MELNHLFPGCHPGVLALDHGIRVGVRGRGLGIRLDSCRACTSLIPNPQSLAPLQMTGVRVELTNTRLSTSSPCQFAYPAVSCRLGCRTRRSGLMRPS